MEGGGRDLERAEVARAAAQVDEVRMEKEGSREGGTISNIVSYRPNTEKYMV